MSTMESSQPHVHFFPYICIMKYVKLFKTVEWKCVWREQETENINEQRDCNLCHNQVDEKNEKIALIILRWIMN